MKYTVSSDYVAAQRHKGHYKTQTPHSRTSRLLLFSTYIYGRAPPNRNNSFLRLLAVRVALLLTPGGSAHASSVTFSKASCYLSGMILWDGRLVVCTGLARCRCRDLRRLHRGRDLAFCCSWPLFWIAWRLSVLSQYTWVGYVTF